MHNLLECGYGKVGPSGQYLLLISMPGFCPPCDKRKLGDNVRKKRATKETPIGHLTLFHVRQHRCEVVQEYLNTAP